MSFYTIPATCSFADETAKFAEQLALDNNVPLSSIKIFLPTRRGARTLQESFLQLSNGKPRLLPIMQSIGDVDLDEAVFHDATVADIPPAIDPNHRQMILARLLERAWPHDYNYSQALTMASDLGHLIDQIHTEDLNIQNLNDIMSVKEFAEYWEMTSSFLINLLGGIWPHYLKDMGMIDGGLHRKLRIQALTAFYKSNPPTTPVIMAGSTGSIPVTREFIKTIGTCDLGHVILPALDTIMDEKTWFHVEPGHPQYLLNNLLTSCHVERSNVGLLGVTARQDRLMLMSEMMRPASQTHIWQSLSGDKNTIESALGGITICEADNDHHESMVIALSLLEIAADPDQQKTAVLITPNRYLAMRVQANLKQWGIDIDDSGGTTLTNTSIGQFTLSVIDAYQNDQIAPVPFLTTLKNPYIGNQYDRMRTHVRSLERELFRGVRPHGNFDALIGQSDKNKDVLSFLKTQFAPFSDFQNGAYDVSDILTAHIQTLENLANSTDETGAERLWKGDDGEALSNLFQSLLACSYNLPQMTLSDYHEFLQSMMMKTSFTANFGKHPRISILGQIESRMIKADRVILSGLNEGIWPPESGFDAWMSRSMRGHFGLPSLEQKTTLSAHDFACGFCASDVFVTRSKKSDGQPTLSSRWLERLNTVLQAADIDDQKWPHKQGEKYNEWARMTIQADNIQPIPRPAPKPDIDRRPTEFSVTEIEKFMRDPYWIYAKKILRLRKLDDVDMDVTVADRGTLIHNTIEKFTTENPYHLPDNAYDRLCEIGEDVFHNDNLNPEIHGLWWPRFTKMAKWFIGHENDWRGETVEIHSELKGTITLGDFKLSGKADRIERRTDGTYAIIDYKTGAAPSAGDVNMGVASQLPLEALILDQAGFDTIAPTDNYLLQYWILNGAGDGGSVTVAQGARGSEISTLMTQARYGLSALLNVFHNTNIPYIASPDASRMIKTEYNDYAHLERISEWMVMEDADD